MRLKEKSEEENEMGLEYAAAGIDCDGKFDGSELLAISGGVDGKNHP